MAGLAGAPELLRINRGSLILSREYAVPCMTGVTFGPILRSLQSVMIYLLVALRTIHTTRTNRLLVAVIHNTGMAVRAG